MADVHPGLAELLTQARTRGFLGPGPLEDQVRHARGFARVLGEAPGHFLDLGSGGGLPGLVLLLEWPEAEGVLLDSSERRTGFLRRAMEKLGLERRTTVVRARAEEAGRDPAWRGRFPVVVARGFGRPAVTAECGSPLVSIGGRLVVSEPPPESEELASREACSGGVAAQAPRPVDTTEPARWPPSGLASLGMVDSGIRVLEEGTFRVLAQQERCPDRFPRRTGVPAKRPLF